MEPREAYLLGFLANAIRGHFLAPDVTRGPAIVSCVMELEAIFSAHELAGFLQPRTLDEQARLAAAGQAAGVALTGGSAAAHAWGRALGTAYGAGDGALLDAASAEEPRARDGLEAARQALARGDLAALSNAARVVEAAVTWPAPRDALRARLDKAISSADLRAAWFAHPTWRTPVRATAGSTVERLVFRFDKSVSFVASDQLADEALHHAVAQGESWQMLRTIGSFLFATVPDVDVLQVDAYVEPTAFYDREQLPAIRRAAAEARAGHDVSDWLRVDPVRVASHSFYLPRNVLDPKVRSYRDASGMDLLAIFTSDANIAAYLDARGLEGAMDHGAAVRVPGAPLFRQLADAKQFFVVDPESRGARRFSPGFAALAAGA